MKKLEKTSLLSVVLLSSVLTSSFTLAMDDKQSHSEIKGNVMRKDRNMKGGNIDPKGKSHGYLRKKQKDRHN